MITWKRTLRTSSSERFLAVREGVEIAAVDLHHLGTGSVAGTLIVLEDAKLDEAGIAALLQQLDEDFLPDVDLEAGNVTFTVVVGKVVANFEPAADEQGRATA
jgi:hypothetical protein